MGLNTKNGTSQGLDWLNVKPIEMIVDVEPRPNTAYLEQVFSTGGPGPDIRIQWILKRLLAINWQKGCFLKVYIYHYCECAKYVNALGFDCSVGLAG